MTSSSCPSGPELDRRRALYGVAGAVVGAPLLASCGGEGTAGNAQPAASPGQELASTSEVPQGSGVILDQAGLVVTQPAAGEFKAFSATCTHQACAVTGVTETIDCVCHGSKFSITDGSVVQGPATEPLPEKPISVEGQRILLG
ncbi:MAG TPA: Rieske (2Fe-2S) protein [Nocardioides sp.]